MGLLFFLFGFKILLLAIKAYSMWDTETYSSTTYASSSEPESSIKTFLRQKAEAEAAEKERIEAENNFNIKGYLKVLGLTVSPSSHEDLKKARRKAMLAAHPDRGGSGERVHQVEYAYENLCKQYGVAA